MSALVREIAVYLRRVKPRDLDRALAELPTLWPQATPDQFERAARMAVAQLEADTTTLLAMAAMWSEQTTRRAKDSKA